ncbi:unnamed protein product [Prorocentrum cordatum]|uniref:Tyr recombinase domain-containing protein n=1 Tax=Prorocentrum cordatum TaxID=2364126 RepID=A0ABN9RPW4_9DINO|nr:unnamed protein product [Polarella glacialis]
MPGVGPQLARHWALRLPPGLSGSPRHSRHILMPGVGPKLAQQLALHNFDADVLASTSRDTEAAKARTIDAIFDMWGLTYPPLTVASVRALGASSLKLGGHRSARSHLALARKRHEQGDHPVSPALAQALKDARRSCERGLGPARKVEGLPLGQLDRLPRGSEAWAPRGPLAPFRMLVAGCWWLTREIEISTAPAAMVTFRMTPSGLQASWLLPASKADPSALGQERTHGCSGAFANVCPAHALWAQRATLRALFPDRHDEAGMPNLDLPLFPSAQGTAVSKEAVVATIQEAARRLGLPATSADGWPLWSGHSLRAGGAQSLAQAGLDIWIIQLLGRWGSSVVLEYARQAPLLASQTWAARASVTARPLAGEVMTSPQLVALRAARQALRRRRTRARPSGESAPSAAAGRDAPGGSQAAPPVDSDAVDAALEPLRERLGALEVAVPAVRLELSEVRGALELEQVEQDMEETSPLEGVVLLQNTAKSHVGIDGFVVHAVLAAESGPPEARTGIARCLWQFGAGVNAARAHAMPGIYKQLCERCFPELRGVHKKRAALRAKAIRRHGGEMGAQSSRTP